MHVADRLGNDSVLLAMARTSVPYDGRARNAQWTRNG